MPRHDIADYLGLTLETVSRMFAELKETGTIKLEIGPARASARRGQAQGDRRLSLPRLNVRHYIDTYI